MDLLGDFQKSVAQASDGRFWGVLGKALALTVALLVGVSIAFAWFLGLLLPDTVTLPWLGEVTFLDNLATLAAIPLLLIGSVFLMIPVAAAFVGIFLDEISGAVEARHYPHVPPVKPLPISEAILDALRFAGVFVLVNGVALIIYFVFAPLAPVIFWIVNGYLLGREYFLQVALRRLPRKEAYALRTRHRFRIWMAGILMAIPLTVPILNLIVPILGVATFTHQFHRLHGMRV